LIAVLTLAVVLVAAGLQLRAVLYLRRQTRYMQAADARARGVAETDGGLALVLEKADIGE